MKAERIIMPCRPKSGLPNAKEHVGGLFYPSPRSHLLFVLLLLAAGAGFGAQPAARKLLPETAVLDRVDGKLLHVDANDTVALRTDDGGQDAGVSAARRDALRAVALRHARPTGRGCERPSRAALPTLGPGHTLPGQELPPAHLLPAPEQIQGREKSGGRRAEARGRQSKSEIRNPKSENRRSPSSPSRRRSSKS